MTFIKGQSGNPGGRPTRTWSWAKLLEEVGEEIEPKSQIEFRELVSRRLWIAAANGNIQAIKELFSRMDGMPTQPFEGDMSFSFSDLAKAVDEIFSRRGTK